MPFRLKHCYYLAVDSKNEADVDNYTGKLNSLLQQVYQAQASANDNQQQDNNNASNEKASTIQDTTYEDVG